MVKTSWTSPFTLSTPVDGFGFGFGFGLFFVLVECHLLAVEILQKPGVMV